MAEAFITTVVCVVLAVQAPFVLAGILVALAVRIVVMIAVPEESVPDWMKRAKVDSGIDKIKISSNAREHIRNVESISTKRGVVGGHNYDEFIKALELQGISADDLIIYKTPHPKVKGVYEIKYQIPRKDGTGKIINPISYKTINTPKTVYDPSIISDNKIYELGIEAMKNGKINGRMVEGTASNGLKFIGYLNDSGEITNFFPIID